MSRAQTPDEPHRTVEHTPSEPERPVRTAIVGAGFFGRSLAAAAHVHPRFEVTTVTDLDRSAAEDLAGRIEARAVADLDAVLADRSVQLVMIATPNHTHTEPAIRALEAGRHVFVEKPLATTAADAQAIVAAAASATGRLMVGHVLRALPGIRRLREEVLSGRLGQVVEGHGARVRVVAARSGPADWWKLDRARSGGELLHELHELDLLVWILGEPAEVRATYGGTVEGHDTTYATTLRFAGGAVATHALSTRGHAASWLLRVSGTTAALEADFRTGLVRRYEDGEVTGEWDLFDDPEANASLRAAAHQAQAHHTAASATPRWMSAAIEHELDEIAAGVAGTSDVLVDAPAVAVLAGIRADTAAGVIA